MLFIAFGDPFSFGDCFALGDSFVANCFAFALGFNFLFLFMGDGVANAFSSFGCSLSSVLVCNANAKVDKSESSKEKFDLANCLLKAGLVVPCSIALLLLSGAWYGTISVQVSFVSFCFSGL